MFNSIRYLWQAPCKLQTQKWKLTWCNIHYCATRWIFFWSIWRTYRSPVGNCLHSRISEDSLSLAWYLFLINRKVIIDCIISFKLSTCSKLTGHFFPVQWHGQPIYAIHWKGYGHYILRVNCELEMPACRNMPQWSSWFLVSIGKHLAWPQAMSAIGGSDTSWHSVLLKTTQNSNGLALLARTFEIQVHFL